MLIRTPRLEIVSWGIEPLRAAVANPANLPHLLNAVIPENWPAPMLGEVLPLFLKKTEEDDRLVNWLLWSWLSMEPYSGKRTLIGDGGYKNIPDAAGAVEIGCAVLPQFQRHGYATEGIAGLVRHAFSIKGITTVYADTDTSNIGARRALEKCGFVECGPGAEQGTIRYDIRFSQI